MSTISVFSGQNPLASPDDPLVSVDDFVETFALSTPSAGETARIQTMLEIASAVIRKGRRQFDAIDGDVVTLTGECGGRTLLLPKDRIPVRDVTLVEQLQPSATDYTSVASGSYDWDEAGIIYLARSAGWWTPRLRGIRVTYNHGYVNLPRDVGGVCLSYAKRLYDHPAGGVIRSETLGDRSVTYDTATGGLLPDEVLTLSQYEVVA